MITKLLTSSFPRAKPVKIKATAKAATVYPLCDSGAQCTLITLKFLQEVFQLNHATNNKIGVLKAANCQTVEVYGTVNFHITLGMHKFAVHANVVCKLNEDFNLD